MDSQNREHVQFEKDYLGSHFLFLRSDAHNGQTRTRVTPKESGIFLRSFVFSIMDVWEPTENAMRPFISYTSDWSFILADL